VLARSFSTVDAPPRFPRRPPKKSMPAAQKVARCARGGSCASASGEAAATFSVPALPVRIGECTLHTPAPPWLFLLRPEELHWPGALLAGSIGSWFSRNTLEPSDALGIW
jgi:hypothetical protein